MTRARDTADQQDNLGGAVAPFVAGKNYIINGAMEIDQRNSATYPATLPDGNASYSFGADRWHGGRAAAATATLGQSSVAPTGFTKSSLWTNGTGITPVSGDAAYFAHNIEGNNIAFLNFGTANAATLTFSFWVRSSLTGTFSGSFVNASSNRSYVFTYSISAANTFEKKTITFTGDTSGTWGTGTGRGLSVLFDMGSGSTNRTSTTNTWVTGFFTGSNGSVQTNATSSSTFYLTGVQLELGNVATPFARAGGSIGGELALCQRYYYRQTSVSAYGWMAYGGCQNTVNGQANLVLPVQMRVVPTALEYANLRITDSSYAGTLTSLALQTGESTPNSADIYVVATGITGGRPLYIGANNNTGAYLAVTAEL